MDRVGNRNESGEETWLRASGRIQTRAIHVGVALNHLATYAPVNDTDNQFHSSKY